MDKYEKFFHDHTLTFDFFSYTSNDNSKKYIVVVKNCIRNFTCLVQVQPGATWFPSKANFLAMMAHRCWKDRTGQGTTQETIDAKHWTSFLTPGEYKDFLALSQ